MPPLEDYAWRLWDYWERHLDPDLFIDRSLEGRVRGQVVVVTGGPPASGTGTAARLAEAGAIIGHHGRDLCGAAANSVRGPGLTAAHLFEADLADLARWTRWRRRS